MIFDDTISLRIFWFFSNMSILYYHEISCTYVDTGSSFHHVSRIFEIICFNIFLVKIFFWNHITWDKFKMGFIVSRIIFEKNGIWSLTTMDSLETWDETKMKIHKNHDTHPFEYRHYSDSNTSKVCLDRFHKILFISKAWNVSRNDVFS